MDGFTLGVLAALTSAFSWAVSTILVKVGMRNNSPVAVNIGRLYIVSAMVLVIFTFSGTFGQILSLKPELFGVAFLSGILGFVVGDYFYFHALNDMGVSRTVPVTSTYPLWVMLWAFLFLGRHISVRMLLGVVLVVASVVIVKRAEESEHSNPRGFLFAILAPVSWSLAILLMDWLTSHVPVLPLAGLRMMSAALGISPILPKYAGELRELTLKELAVLTGVALSGLLVGQYFFVYAVGKVGSQIAAPVSAINPIISSALAVLILGEPPNGRILIGLLLAVSGVILISA